MTAFIGVRISWLIAARNVLLARSASSAASRAASPSRNRRALSMAIAACCDMPTSRSRSFSVNCLLGMVRQAANTPTTWSRAINEATISRSSMSGSVPGISTLRPSPLTSLMTSASRRSTMSPMIPSPTRIESLRTGSASAPIATIALSVSPSGWARNRAVESTPSSDCASSTICCRTAVRSRFAEISRPTSASAAISRARRRVSSYSRAFEIADPTFAASVESSRTSSSPKRPSCVVLWTLMTPIASSPWRIGTPR